MKNSLFLWNLSVCTCVHKLRSLECVSLPIPLTTSPSITLRSSKIHFHIILLFITTSPEWFHSSVFSIKNLFFFTLRATCFVNIIFLHLLTVTLDVLGEKYELQSFSLCNFLQFPATSPTLLPNILLSTLNSKFQ